MKYTNRYGETLIFHQEGTLIRITGHESDYLRVSRDEENKIRSVDPSGGPYLFVGLRLGALLEALEDTEIVSISLTDSEIHLQVKYDSLLEKDK
jgi:hypothetical protein